jgi:hypothetical protein
MQDGLGLALDGDGSSSRGQIGEVGVAAISEAPAHVALDRRTMKKFCYQRFRVELAFQQFQLFHLSGIRVLLKTH